MSVQERDISYFLFYLKGGWYWEEESDNYPPGHFTMGYSFDFFNYAGIHRQELALF